MNTHVRKFQASAGSPEREGFAGPLSSPGDQANYYQLLYEQERLNRELLEQEQKKKQQQIQHLQQLISTVLALVVLAA